MLATPDEGILACKDSRGKFAVARFVAYLAHEPRPQLLLGQWDRQGVAVVVDCCSGPITRAGG